MKLGRPSSLPKANILFPLETTVREFESKILLAAKILRPDRRVYLGHQQAMIRLLPHLHGGIYVGKNLLRPHYVHEREEYDALKAAGIVVMYLDEEGAVFAGSPDDWRTALLTRIDPRLWEPDDYVCAWGEFQRAYYANLPGEPGAKVVTTGHPRFDLYDEPYRHYFDEDVERLRREYGQFVLINTNFPRASHQYGIGHVFSEEYGYNEKNPDPWIKSWAHVQRVMTNFVEMVHEAAVRFPETKFVIRPHPSEEWSFWEAIFAGRPNILMRHEGPVAPWMMAAGAVIHDGCTTGIEAYLAGARLINYRSLPESAQNVYLPNLFGRPAQTIPEVLDHLAEFLNGAKPDTVTLPQQALDLMHSFAGDAFVDLTACMEDALSTVGEAHTPDEVGVRLCEAPWQLKEGAKDFVRPVDRYRYHLWRTHRSRFRDFEEGWVREALGRVERVMGVRMEPTFVSSRFLYLDLA